MKFPVLLFLSTASWVSCQACVELNESALEREKFKAVFAGELVEQGEVVDALGRVNRRWATFDPIKPVWGLWSTKSKVYFPPSISSLDLIPGRVYIIEVEQDDFYSTRCALDYDLRGYSSFDDNGLTQRLRYRTRSIFGESSA